MKVVIIGGGIIGMCCAYYLNKKGIDVHIIEKTDGKNGCSFGNAGYISPSHYIPLASPGIISQGLKWMLSSSSPFYIKPRFDLDLIKWGLKFWSNCNEHKVNKSIPALNQFLHYSREKTIDMSSELKNSFDLELNGCYMMYRLQKTADHELELCHRSKELGIDTKVYSKEELQQLEPNLGITSLGAVFYPIDAHLNPIKWMNSLKSHLENNGVHFSFNSEVSSFEKKSKKILALYTNQKKIEFDHLIIASGSWLPHTLKKLNLNILLQPGKGYSTTYENQPINLSKPAILVDDRVALTPLGSSLRVGGTMEISGINNDIKLNRVEAIINAVNKNFVNLNLTMPPENKIWNGLRPVSPDGLPYVGHAKSYDNLTIAGGHAMIGVSLAAGTGKIISDLINHSNTEIDIKAFAIDR
ncbi:MAG: hypothetical protein RLZZ546_1515 [Bacteroidota bacterium]|jgi:D-amino-acid dehydrogenase